MLAQEVLMALPHLGLVVLVALVLLIQLVAHLLLMQVEVAVV